ncbi:hypothetical protein ARMGADRAFT_1077687 [Armillaria gallica]|uniref:Uncharacterized protein n=1 Tax=Armillaria gallica TaxID=47427 RepID=A0A2H3E4C2_ARMGA|nr:hypothetical protein ARMGADRAFT_1077687 [Armillaria gallica]
MSKSLAKSQSKAISPPPPESLLHQKQREYEVAAQRMQDLVDERFHHEYPPHPEEEMEVYSKPMSEPLNELKKTVGRFSGRKGKIR